MTPPAGPGGLTAVDKPAGWTSHDVVARIRRLAGTRRVGHAGTLDPMATGVLVLGIERGTKLLGHLAVHEKSYDATIRLGQSTITDDAEGELLASASAAGVTEAAVRDALTGFVGELDQIPAAVSAIKVAGRRSYARVRAGEAVQLKPRRVTVRTLELRALRRPEPALVDVDVSIDCSSGTYVRAVARDLGVVLGVGGHLTALRRTAAGPFTLAETCTLDELAALDSPVTRSLSAAVVAAFPRRDVPADEALALSHGRPLAAVGKPGSYGVFGPDGEVVALVEERDGRARPVVVLRPA
jgi:tRNA pseudouridine55 synthase